MYSDIRYLKYLKSVTRSIILSFIIIFTLCMWFPHIVIDFVFVLDMVILYFPAISFKWCDFYKLQNNISGQMGSTYYLRCQVQMTSLGPSIHIEEFRGIFQSSLVKYETPLNLSYIKSTLHFFQSIPQ